MKGDFSNVSAAYKYCLIRSSGRSHHFFVAFFLFLFSFGPLVGQVALVDKAFELTKKKDYVKARETIDQASKDEAANKDARTWYLKGYIYSELYKANQAEDTKLREQALEYLLKSQRLDTKGTYRKDIQSTSRYLHITYYNEAIQQYNLQNYEQALSGLKKFLQLRASEVPDETYAEALYYAGYTSVLTGKNLEAQGYYERALQLRYKDPLLYNDLGSLYEELGKDSLGLEMISRGRREYPADTTLRLTQINMLLSRGKLVKAEQMVDEFLQMYPNHIEVMLVAGSLYEKISQSDTLNREKYFEKRKATYRKVLALDPSSFPANYNMGITLYNRGVDIIKSQQYDLDIVVLYELLEKVSILFKEAKPYVEKASKLSPNNVNALRALEGIYYNLNEKDKSKQMRALINGLK
jgi:tetratricopeptide (TPR) repeat protein